MSSKRRNFDEQLEPLIYWDTTFAFTTFSAAEPFHTECVVFRKRLDAECGFPPLGGQEGGFVSVVSDFVYDELAFVLMKRSLLAEARRIGKQWMDVYNEHPFFLSTIYPGIQIITTPLPPFIKGD
jgi:hypothetical protein